MIAYRAERWNTLCRALARRFRPVGPSADWINDAFMVAATCACDRVAPSACSVHGDDRRGVGGVVLFDDTDASGGWLVFYVVDVERPGEEGDEIVVLGHGASPTLALRDAAMPRPVDAARRPGAPLPCGLRG
jgi:hypothetical protein